MNTKIFVNLPIKELARTTEFFTKIGFTFNKQFTDEKATCMVISDDIYAMLLLENFFSTFTNKAICDTTKSVESIIALSTDSRAKVDEIVDKALAAGGTEPRPAQDQGFMYTRNFQDLDGHLWEILYMDPSFVQ